MKYTLIVFFFLLPFITNSQTVVINEVTAINDSYADEDGNFPDWIELYNPNSSTISLEDWTITDDKEQPQKWIFPSTNIDAGDFILLFASNKDRIAGSQLHTNFRLNGGETLYLYNALGDLQDSLAIPTLRADISIGRYPDGTSITKVFEETTPKQENASVNFDGIITNEITFFEPSGLYENSIQVELDGAAEGEEIRITSDGTIPDESSFIYSSTITITRSLVLKAIIYKEGYLPSPVYTSTYIIGPKSSLPVVSLSVDPKDFFDEKEGIYVEGIDFNPENPLSANYFRDVEIPISLSFFDSKGEMQFDVNAGTKIFGTSSRKVPQKSLSIFFRSRYGQGSLKYPLFANRPYDTFEAFILRNSGSDWQDTMIRDLTLTGLMMDSEVDIQAGRPVISYLNGEYWGIYNIREKINEHYLASLHDISADEITILQNRGNLVTGTDRLAYLDMISFVENEDLRNEDNYKIVLDQIDSKNFIQYQLANIYFDNTDWPGNNVKFWKSTTGKWRWILFDTDFGFGMLDPENYLNNSLVQATTNGPGFPNPLWSIILLQKLLTNDQFKNTFINTFADELNTRFLPENVNQLISINAERISQEINRQISRWGFSTRNRWEERVNAMKTFATNRPTLMRGFIQDHFNLPAQHDVHLNISNPEGGSVELNSINIQSDNWSGIYFESVPITLTARPRLGYTFEAWSGTITSTDSSISIDPDQVLSLTAHFKINNPALAERDIIFNEINYNSSDEKDAGDWVELYNNGPNDVDLSNWVFKDNNDEHIFSIPEGTTLATDAYLVLANSLEKFETQYPTIDNKIGDFDFKLSSDGEFIRLYDAQNELVDSVWYLPYGQWPEAANGTGTTLELKMPDSDNTLGKNWAATSTNGTPGELNTSDVICEINIPLAPCDNLVIINEINYNSSPEKDAGDWVELYNANDCAIDVSNFVFQNSQNDHLVKIPEGTILAANDFLVLVADKFKFEQQFPTMANIIEGTNFDLPNEGEFIGLYDQNDLLTDFVWYNSDDTWPDNTNGTGATLELKDPNLDNFQGANWTSFPYNGTPGSVNGDYLTSIKAEDTKSIVDISPNPFINEINLTIGKTLIGKEMNVKLLDLSGKLISDLYKASNNKEEEIQLTIPEIATGMYFILINIEGDEIMKRVIKQRK